MLRRSELKRKTPLRATGSRLSSGSGATLARQSTLQRAAIKRRAPKKRAGHEPKYLAACRGEPCFLQIPGVCRGELESVVPCHANWSAYGKGMGIKAKDIYTVPGCFRCHQCLDQGFSLTDAEKRATWEWAYNRWLPVRAGKLQEAV
ncbi:nuclease domain-containing protein [Achromobacter denitrificans]|uniref:nuclease domain-containing protein n=1 Tax=Achromobacter denitrificans TaxID=32002 RepID=UPI003B9AFEF7